MYTHKTHNELTYKHAYQIHFLYTTLNTHTQATNTAFVKKTQYIHTHIHRIHAPYPNDHTNTYHIYISSTKHTTHTFTHKHKNINHAYTNKS